MKLIVIAQLFGIMGACSTVLSSWQKNRDKMLLYLMFDNILYFIQYLLLNALTGAMTSIVSLIRTLSFRRKNKSKFFKTNAMLYIIIFLYIAIAFVAYDGVFSLFPIFAGCLNAVILWQNKTKSIRKGSAIMFLMWFIYNLTVKAYVGALVEFILFLSTILAIFKLDKKKQRKSFGGEVYESNGGEGLA